MSRTDAHVPEAVEVAHTTNRSIIDIEHRHWVHGVGYVGCLDPRADHYEVLPRWASRQPWTRRSVARIERRSIVRDTLRKAAVAYRSAADLDDVMMPDPDTFCLCLECGPLW